MMMVFSLKYFPTRNGIHRIVALFCLILFIFYQTRGFLRDFTVIRPPFFDRFLDWKHFETSIKTQNLSVEQKLFLKEIVARFPLLENQLNILIKSTSSLSLKELENAHEILHLLCSVPKMNAKSCSILPPFVSMPSQYKIAAKYRLVACSIFKNMSTLLASLMCYLHDKKLMVNHTNFYMGWDSKTACLHENNAGSLIDLLWRFGVSPTESHKFSLVREPKEKFISGHVNQCSELNRCDSCRNTTCTLEKIDRYARDLVKSAQYEGPEKYRHHVNAHFLPQNWRCEFGSRFDEYQIIRYDSGKKNELKRDLRRVFELSKVPQGTIEFLLAKLDQGRGMHSTLGNSKTTETDEDLSTNPRQLRKLVSLFYFDYLIFEYRLPKLGNLVNTNEFLTQ